MRRSAFRYIFAVSCVFACVCAVAARGVGETPDTTVIKPPSVMPAPDWLRIDSQSPIDLFTLQKLRPRLHDYWAARSAYDRVACRRLVTPQFTFESEISGDGPHRGANAIEAVSSYSDRPVDVDQQDADARDLGRVLSVHKLFAKQGRMVLYLTETLKQTLVMARPHREPLKFISTDKWYWKQTWVRWQGEWMLTSVVNRDVEADPVSKHSSKSVA